MIKCDVCGKFISYSDLDSGMAIRKMITPDSDYSGEEWETLCKNHNRIKCEIDHWLITVINDEADQNRRPA